MGDTNYTTQAQSLRTRFQDITTEVEAARISAATLSARTLALKTEIEAAREGEASIVANLSTNYWKNGSFSASANVNNQKIINAVTGTTSEEAVTLAAAQAIEALGAGGIDQSKIAVTKFLDGTATNGQRYVISGAAVVGEDNLILTTEVTGLTANELVGANAGAAALEKKDLTNISPGGMTASERVQTNSTGIGFVTLDSDLEDSAVALFSILSL